MKIGQDFRYALRSLVKRPGFTVVIALTLALGIGANAAIFSMIDALVLRPFPIPDIDRLVQIYETVPSRGDNRDATSPATYLDWKSQADGFESLEAYAYASFNLTGGDRPERVEGASTTPGFLHILGIEPVLGRLPSLVLPSEEEKTIVLSHRLWTRRFAADPSVIGSTVLLDGIRYDVTAVAPPGFKYPEGAEFWTPLVFSPKTAQNRTSSYLNVVGRLKDGLEVEDIQASMDVIATRLAQQHPAESGGRGVNAMALKRAVMDIGMPVLLSLFQATVLFVLLIACVNVANLLLARGADREREIAVRMALGAGRRRIIRQLFVENLLLALIGAALAIPFAWFGLKMLRDSLPAEIQKFVMGWEAIGVDWRMLSFTALAAVVASLAFGLLPSLAATRLKINSALTEGGRGAAGGKGRIRGRSLLVLVETALALTLLVAAGLTIQGSQHAITKSQGFDPDGVMTMQVILPASSYPDAQRRRDFHHTILERIRGQQGVDSADMINIVPYATSNRSRYIDVEGSTVVQTSDRPLAHYRVASPGYFKTLGIPLVAGRNFQSSDDVDSVQVALVSQKMARQCWPNHDPIGRRFRFNVPNAPWISVVGVVADVTHHWFLGGPSPTLYRPLTQVAPARMTLAIKTHGDPASLTPMVRAQVEAVDPNQPISNVYTLRKLVSVRMIGLRYMSVVMGLFGVTALILCLIGLYGLIAYSVGQRTGEIGIRMALGARRPDVFRLTVGGAAKVTLLGTLIGMVLAWGVGGLLERNLFGLVSLDIWSVLAFASILLVASAVAAWVASRRALGIDPCEALRAE